MTDKRWQIEVYESGASWTGGGMTYGYALYAVWTDEEGFEIRDLLNKNNRYNSKENAISAAKEYIKKLPKVEALNKAIEEALTHEKEEIP